MEYHSANLLNLFPNGVLGFFIGNGGMDKGSISAHRLNFFKSFLLQGYVVIVAYGVNSDDLYVYKVREQSFHKVAAYEACNTGYKNCPAR